MKNSKWLVLLVMLTLASTLASVQASSRTLVVDDDGADCPGAAFQSIQAAVDAASAGDTIKVCPGTYQEDVSVTKTLKILGPKHGKNARSRNLQSPGEAVVTGARPFFLGADDIVLDGFTIVVLPDNAGEGAGILTSDQFSGYQILNNVGDADGVTLLFPGCDGQKVSLARGNHFFNRFGIATSDDEPRATANNLVIEDNLFTDSSILIGSGTDLNIFIMDNRLEGNPQSGFGIELSGAQGVILEGNKIFGLHGDAVRVGSSMFVIVAENILRDGTGNALWLESNSSYVEVDGNHIAGFAAPGAYGVLLQQCSAVDVTDNEVEDGSTGIALLASTGNHVEGNDIEDNKANGLYVSPDSTANIFKQNELGGNRPLDCQDDSTGSGTARTANVWSKNDCHHSQPQAICH